MTIERVRKILREASRQSSTSMVKSWLLNDERGFWERTVLDFIEKSNERARTLGLTEEQQDEEIVVHVRSLAVTAALKHATKQAAR